MTGLHNSTDQKTAMHEPALHSLLRVVAKAMVRNWLSREVTPPQLTHVPSATSPQLRPLQTQPDSPRDIDCGDASGPPQPG